MTLILNFFILILLLLPFHYSFSSCTGEEEFYEAPLMTVDNTYEKKKTHVLSIRLNCEDKLLNLVERIYKKRKYIKDSERLFPLDLNQINALNTTPPFGDITKYEIKENQDDSYVELYVYYAAELSLMSKNTFKKVKLIVQKNKQDWIVGIEDQDDIFEVNHFHFVIDTSIFGIPKSMTLEPSKMDHPLLMDHRTK